MGDESIVSIDCGIHSFREVAIHPRVKSVNLHCNEIEHIEDLEAATCLEILNVSSNKLKFISGLGNLLALRSLNLASNFISSISGLEGLTNLQTLNLSYNKIKSLDGLAVFQGTNCCLADVELHGNQLSDIKHVSGSLKGITSLKHLVLTHGKLGADNPLCHEEGYVNTVLKELPQLWSLDRIDRGGKARTFDLNFSALSKYEPFLDCADVFENRSSAALTISCPATNLLSIPNVDAVLAKHSVSKNVSAVKTDKDRASLVPSKGNANSIKDQEAVTPFNASNAVLIHETLTSADDFVSDSVISSSLGTQQVKMSMQSPEISSCSQPSANTSSKKSKLQKSKHNGTSLQRNVKTNLKQRTLMAKQLEVGNHTVEKATYLNLVKELETERERRWKAEQASRQLVTNIQKIQAESCDSKGLQNLASQTVDRLKKRLVEERETNEKLKVEAENVINEKNSLLVKIKTLDEAREKQCDFIDSLQKKLSGCNSEHSHMKAVHSKKMDQVQSQLAAVLQQFEHSKLECNKLYAQVEQLEKMMATKDKDFQRALQGLHAPESPEIQRLISKHVACKEKSHQMEVSQLEEKLSSLQQEYIKLENEFREALCIENQRYHELLKKHESVAQNSSKLEELLTSATAKEEKARCLITDLSGIVKEQKSQLKQLEKSKQESIMQYRDRINSLELSAEDNKKLSIQLELMKQEKSKLLSQVTALQSVVDGLKEERRLWSLELAQQGSSLSKDRGRLEMKIDALNAELKSLRKNNEKDLDCLKIKTKIVEDQTETISKLKEALVQKDKEIGKKLDEHLLEQKKLQEVITELQEENTMLQEENNHLLQRKQQLKVEISASQKQCDSLLENQEALKKKWSDKAKLLGKLELQVKQISETSVIREKALKEEHDAAVHAQHLMAAKMKEQDQAFQDQLETLSVAHSNEVQRREHDKVEEINFLKSRIQSVEDEMREVLKDSEVQKQAQENMLTKIKQTFSELNIGVVY